MNLIETDLCHFCSDLIKASNDAETNPAQRPHHATYGSLLPSSQKCILCQFISSLWPRFRSRLIRQGLSHETIESSQRGYAVKVWVKEARHMPSGVCWVFLEAKLEGTNTPLSFISYFTVITCDSSEGKTDYVLYLDKVRGSHTGFAV